MKKRIGMTLMLISGILAVYLICFLGNPVRLEDISVDAEQLAALVGSRQTGDSSILEALYFDGQQLMLDTSTDTFYYSLVEGSKGAYNPCVKKQSASKEVSVVMPDAPITAEDVRENRTLRLIAYDAKNYYEYSLKCTTLPLMNIECDAEIGAENVPAHMTLFDNSRGAAQKFTESDGNIHVRGKSTSAYPKKGYKLSLTKESLADNVRLNKVSLLGMRQDDDWILYAAYNDPEKIRNVFSSSLWKNTCAGDNALGIDNGMEYQYLELFINHEYWGLYALGYPVDELQLGIDASENERLYKKGTWDTEEQILSKSEMAVAGYETKESDEDEWELLKQYYATLHSEWENAQSMYEGIDIDNAIDMYLFINLIQGIDHVGAIDSHSIKNMYLSFYNRGGKKTVLYTPWDMDITWGLQWTGDAETNLVKPYGIKSSQNTVMGLGNLPALILTGDDEIWDLILTKYWTLRKELWSEENISKMLDGFEEDIYFSGAYARDMERWPDGSYWDAEKGLMDFRAYVADRLLETDDYYRRLEETLSDEDACDNVYIVRSMQYKDFLSSDFILLLNDRTLLAQDDYQAFLEYIGIDTGRLTDNVKFAVVNGAKKQVEYFEALDAAEGIDTCIGHIRLEDSPEQAGSFLVYVDEALWCDMDLRGLTKLELAFGDREKATHFDFTREYVMWSRLCEQENPQGWCEELKSKGYDVLIEIVNHDAVSKVQFRALLEGFGVDADSVSQNTDFIAIQTADGAATVLNDSHTSGARGDTVLGTFSIFYNDEGGYGVYRNDEQCILVYPQDNENVDVRAAVITSDPYQVIWCPTFSY